MPPGGARPGSGRKSLGNTVHTTILLDGATRQVLDRHASGSRSRGVLIRQSLERLLEDLAARRAVAACPLIGKPRNFRVRIPVALREAAEDYYGDPLTARFAGLSEMIRTAVARSFADQAAST